LASLDTLNDRILVLFRLKIKNCIIDKVCKVPIKDLRLQTGKAIVPNIESIYIAGDIMGILQLHDKVKAEFTLLNPGYWLTKKDLNKGVVDHSGCMYISKCPC
jgi:hypothetical protein